MTLKKLAKWLAIAALLGGLVAFVAFQEASIKIDGRTMSIEQFIQENLDIEYQR